EKCRTVGGRVARRRRTHPEREGALGFVAGPPVLQARKAVEQQSRSSQQHAGERELADDEHPQRATPTSAPPIAVLERNGKAGARRSERRNEREEDRRPERDREREDQRRHIDRRRAERSDRAVVVASGRDDGGSRAREETQSPGRDDRAGDAGD